MDMNGKKICVDCKHYNTDHTGAVCMADESKTVDPVYGTPHFRSCFLMRGPGLPCGPDGKLYREL